MFRALAGWTVLAFVLVTLALPAQEAQEAVTLRTFVAPAYPAQAKAERKQGPAILELDVAADGSVKSVRIVKAYPIFGEFAADALGKWRFNPLSHDITLNVTVDFLLVDGGCDDPCGGTKVSADLPNTVRVEASAPCVTITEP